VRVRLQRAFRARLKIPLRIFNPVGRPAVPILEPGNSILEIRSLTRAGGAASPRERARLGLGFAGLELSAVGGGRGDRI
jgi:hypothetical protein